MNIQFILSDTNISATSGALREVLNKAERDVFSDVLVLVPETKSIAIERELLDKSQNGAFSNIYIYSFVRLLSRIGGVKEENIVTKQTCIMILRRLILENLDKLHCYKKTAKSLGFAEKIYETIQQFKSSSYTAKDVWGLAQSTDGALRSKMQDIALLFDLFEEELAKGFFDDCDRLRILGELAKTNEFIKKADVFVVGFDNVTSDMINVLKEFAVHSKSITFSCVYFNENRKDKYIQDNLLYRKFKSIADSLKYPYNPKFVKSYFSGDFWNIQNYLYSSEKKCVPSQGDVHVFALDTKSKEIDTLANLILTEVRNGKRYKDLAVVDANFDKDIDEISKVFDDYNIPYYISKSYDISEHYLIRFIKNSIEAINSKLASEKVLKWLSNPIVGIEGFEEFELYVKASGINYSEFLIKATEEHEQDEEKLEKINKYIEFISKFYNRFSNDLLKEQSISKFVEIVQEILVSVNVEDKLINISQFEKENGLDINSEISSTILEKVTKVGNNMSRFLGDRIVSLQEFLQIYLSGFAEEEINLLPASVDSVFIQKNADGLYNIKDLFVISAVDGVFPVKMADTGMLQDVELDELSGILCKSVEPTIKELNKREKFIAYELMLLPKEKLFVLYSTHSFGMLNKPANIVSRLVKLFGLEIKNDCKINKFITQKIAEKQFASRVGEYLCGEDLSVAELNREYNSLKEFLTPNFENYISHLTFGEKEFKIQDAKEIYFLNNKTSVSQLEKYFACPYSFFARYGLRLKENKDAKLNSLDIGTIIHKFAEIFTKEIKEFSDIDDKKFEEKTKAIFDQSLISLNVNKTKNFALLRFIEDESLRLAKYLCLEQEKSSFKNDSRLNEFEFFGNNAVRLNLDDNTVISIEGKIDRIDRFGDYIRIIDYKTGDTDSNLNSIYYGKKIQLVSYLSASEKLGEVAGLFYFPIHSDFVKKQQKIKNNYKMQGFLLDNIDVVKYMDSGLSLENNESGFVPLKIKNNKETRESGEFQISYGRTKNFLSKNEFDDVKNYTNQLCKQAVTEILDGNIAPAPFAKNSEKESIECRYCELAGFCGKEHSKFGDARRCGGAVDEASFKITKGE